MSAEQLLADDRTTRVPPPPRADATVGLIRESFALVAPQAEELARHFYATLFSQAPETRDLFPVNMEVQRSRLLRAVQVAPDEIVLQPAAR